MSTFRQIVEGYAENLSNAAMRASVPIKRIGTIDSEINELDNKLTNARTTFNKIFRQGKQSKHYIDAYRVADKAAKVALDEYVDSFHKLAKNPNLSREHLLALHGMANNTAAPDHIINDLFHAVLTHKNADGFIKGVHYERTGERIYW